MSKSFPNLESSERKPAFAALTPFERQAAVKTLLTSATKKLSPTTKRNSKAMGQAVKFVWTQLKAGEVVTTEGIIAEVAKV